MDYYRDGQKLRQAKEWDFKAGTVYCSGQGEEERPIRYSLARIKLIGIFKGDWLEQPFRHAARISSSQNEAPERGACQQCTTHRRLKAWAISLEKRHLAPKLCLCRLETPLEMRWF